MPELGVNEHHQAQVVNYMRFARYQRAQRLRAVDMCFEEMKQSRLDETTYTIDEVTEILDSLLMVVRGEVDSELINTVHTNILLMRQVFQQAEKWHLKLQADISELENRELLEQIADFEEKEFAGAKRDKDLKSVLSGMKLIPLNETGGAALLHTKIEELSAENAALKSKYDVLDSSAKDSFKHKQTIEDDMRKTRSELESLRGRQVSNKHDVDGLQRRMADLQSELDMSKKSSADTTSGMETDLASTKHELLRIREMLEMAEKELEKKVSQTAPFKNLKQMIQKKNDQMRDLRKRLAKYETVDDD
ncbi:hypothetical protein ScPMuIL_011958 [Solemya velum]